MWDYSDQVKEHFFNPRNAGVLADANAIGEAGSLACGDALKLMLKVDPESDVIVDAKFQAFGCGSAIAASSALTELLIGRTLEEAHALSNQDVVELLGDLPSEKLACAQMGQDALRAALAGYRGEADGGEADPRGRLVCRCYSVRAGALAQQIRALELTSIEQVRAQTNANANCSACREAVEQVLAATNQAMVDAGQLEAAQAFQADPRKTPPKRIASQFVNPALARKPAPQPVAIQPLAARPAATGGADASIVREAIQIARILEEARPSFKADGGDVELVDYADSTVFVTLSGVCAGCSAASLTLGGLRQKIVQALGRPVRVAPVPKR